MRKDDSSLCTILCCLVKMLSFNHPLRISKEGKTCVTDMLFVRFSNTAINDQVTVNPSVPVTVLKLRV